MTDGFHGFLINSGLQSIILLDRITAIGRSEILGTATFDGKAIFALIEALAQLGAFHIRQEDSFRRQVFLMKVGKCLLPDPLSTAGQLAMRGKLAGRSDRSYVYQMRAKRHDEIIMEGEFWFSTIDYDERFDGPRLKTHYEQMFACLTSASETA